MEKSQADFAADELIATVLKTQPNFLSGFNPHKDSGNAVGDFIAALHTKLSAMYQQRN